MPIRQKLAREIGHQDKHRGQTSKWYDVRRH